MTVREKEHEEAIKNIPEKRNRVLKLHKEGQTKRDI